MLGFFFYLIFLLLNVGFYDSSVQTSPSPTHPIPQPGVGEGGFVPLNIHEQTASRAPELAAPPKPLPANTAGQSLQHPGSGVSPGSVASRRRLPRGPTVCSTSRAVYLLIASFTITHNNQLRHCQRNTHSWPCRRPGCRPVPPLPPTCG